MERIKGMKRLQIKMALWLANGCLTMSVKLYVLANWLWSKGLPIIMEKETPSVPIPMVKEKVKKGLLVATRSGDVIIMGEQKTGDYGVQKPYHFSSKWGGRSDS